MCASDTLSASRLTSRTLTQGAKALLLPIVLVAASMVANAQSDKDAEQVKRLRLQMRQIQQQQQEAQEAQAKADQARLQAESALKSQEGELQKQRSAASSAGRRAATLAKELDALKPEHERVVAELAALKAQHQALTTSAKAAQAQASETEASLRAQVGSLTSQLQKATADNLALAELGLELLQRYENKGMAEVLSASEPFVQTGRVKLENLKADYERRIQAARVKGTPSELPAAR